MPTLPVDKVSRATTDFQDKFFVSALNFSVLALPASKVTGTTIKFQDRLYLFGLLYFTVPPTAIFETVSESVIAVGGTESRRTPPQLAALCAVNPRIGLTIGMGLRLRLLRLRLCHRYLRRRGGRSCATTAMATA